MQSPPLDPPVSDTAPSSGVVTGYDEQHLVTYLRLLDAEAEGADWHEVARIVLHIDPAQEPERAHRALDLSSGARSLDDRKRLPTPPSGWRTALAIPVPCSHGNGRCQPRPYGISGCARILKQAERSAVDGGDDADEPCRLAGSGRV